MSDTATSHDERLIDACKRGDLLGVRQSLPLADVFFKFGQPMQWAVQFGHLDIVQELWPHYQDSSFTKGLLNMAAWHGHAEVVEFFMPHLASTDVVRECTEDAVEQEHVDVLRILTQHPEFKIAPWMLIDMCNGHLREMIDVVYPHLDPVMLAEFLQTQGAHKWYLYDKYHADQQAAVLNEAVDPQMGRVTGRSKL